MVNLIRYNLKGETLTELGSIATDKILFSIPHMCSIET